MRGALIVVVVAAAAVGCTSRGGSPATGPGAGDGGLDATADAPDAPLDVSTPDAAPPGDAAPPMAAPSMQYLGGRILSAPKVVTITFPGDDPALTARLAQFDDSITSTPWWKAVASEYCVQPAGAPCVGPGTGGGHVVMPATAAAAFTDSIHGGDSSLRALLDSAVADGTLPAPDAQTLYVVYLPAGTRILLDGIEGCAPSSFAGYHDAIAATPPDAGTSVEAAYAVVARCSSTEAATTIQASHEIVEAATDPSPENGPAYQLTDLAWTAFGPEVADACAAVDASLTAVESGFAVQRSWSNASATAGHDPCVPVPPGEVYFNVAPAQGAETLPLAVGQSATIPLYPFADGPSSGWQVSGVAANGSPLSFTVTPSTVSPGVHATLTVTLQSKPALGVDQLYGIVSQSGSEAHVWPMIVQAK